MGLFGTGPPGSASGSGSPGFGAFGANQPTDILTQQTLATFSTAIPNPPPQHMGTLERPSESSNMDAFNMLLKNGFVPQQQTGMLVPGGRIVLQIEFLIHKICFTQVQYHKQISN
jgi:hypothetical protein